MSSHLRSFHLWFGLCLVVLTSGVSTVTLTHEQRVRDAVAELTGACKSLVEYNMGVLMSGCSTFEAFQISFTGNCNKTQLDKIHTAVCNFSLSTATTTTAKPATTDRTTYVQHAINISMFLPLAQTHKELVDYVIANISSEDCRAMIQGTIANMLSGDDTSWCGKLLMYQDFLIPKCEQNDYNNFKEAMCMTFVKAPTSTTLKTTSTPTPTSTTSTSTTTVPPIISLYLPLSESHKDLVRLIIYNISSDNCKAVVTSDINTIFEFSESQWCFYFSSYGDALVNSCSKADIDIIRIAMCMPFIKPPSTSAKSTSPLMTALLSSTTEAVPTHSTTRSTTSTVEPTSQRTTDRTPVNTVSVHTNETPVHTASVHTNETPAHTASVHMNETRLQKALREVGYDLTTPTCKQLLEAERQTLSSFPEGCCMLESPIGMSLVPSVCTQLEYDRVHNVLCVNVTCTTTAPPEHVTDSSGYMTTGTSDSTTPTHSTVTTTTNTTPPKANIFPLKLRLLFSVITNDNVTEQLEVLVN
ncbi:uncharacterized protein LOC131944951 [Physella acuta]|uniref:uncharacterized protein LOC131944951 n=1 Tax=Physella acuta TaxID=109671 RepID=UPI0027DAF1B0|nr:uncharacterized protein LOC131944951 [Physella acuta]